MSKLDRLKQSSANARESIGADADLSVPVTQAAPKPQWVGVAKMKSAAMIEVARIRRDENQPREEFGQESLERLAASLRTKGQLQPVQVRWDPAQESYILIAGERRWRAAQIAGLPTVAAVIHEGKVDPTELLELQLIENVLREDLTPIEQANAYKRLMDSRGWSGNQLAKELAISQPRVVMALKLLGLPDEVQGQVEAGKLSQDAAYEISKLKDPQKQIQVAREAVQDRAGSKQVRARIQTLRAGGSPRLGKLEVERNGYKIIVRGDVADEDALWATWLEIYESRGKTSAA